jgi:hypothetical protein
MNTAPAASEITVFAPGTVPHVRRLPARFDQVLLMTEMLGHLLSQRGFQHILGERCRAGLSLLCGLTTSDVVPHSAHPA